MRSIPFTQYLRPNGQRRKTFFPISDDELADRAEEIMRAGYVFTAELIMATQLVVLTISDDQEDLAIVISNNGPEITDSIHSMIRDFDLSAVTRRK